MYNTLLQHKVKQDILMLYDAYISHLLLYEYSVNIKTFYKCAREYSPTFNSFYSYLEFFPFTDDLLNSCPPLLRYLKYFFYIFFNVIQTHYFDCDIYFSCICYWMITLIDCLNWIKKLKKYMHIFMPEGNSDFLSETCNLCLKLYSVYE
jgi:hypothetical protein